VARNVVSRSAVFVALTLAAFGQLGGAQESGRAAAMEPSDPPQLGERGFIERFESLDESRWMAADGWSNGDWMANDFLRRQVATGPDGLTITLAESEGREKPYVSGEIRTIGKRFHYGYCEIDMRAPRGSGLVSGFFTYTGSFFGDPHDEIDIEILGRSTREVTFTTFTDGERNSTVVPLGFDAAEDFHLYAFEWTKDYVRWFVDGELKHEVRAEDVPLPQTPQIYYLDLWNSETLTDWVGRIDRDGAPWTLEVRCLAYAESNPGRTVCREP
jgi:endo-1,3-1,4-beta-glycanase ExoK